MGQADILVWFHEHPGWHTVGDVAQDLGRTAWNIRKIMQKLRRNQDLECKSTDGKAAKIYRVNKPKE